MPLSRSFRTGAAVVLAAVLTGALASTQPASAAGAADAPVADPTTLVNPWLGTGSGGPIVGSVNAFPGASAPFGMLTWSPETTSRPAGGGYNYADSATTGLSVTHLSGVGCPIQGDLPILPTSGDIGAAPGTATQPFSHSGEQASPGSYSADFGGITTDIAATTRAGIGELAFPAGPQANLLFKAGYSQNGTTDSTVRIDGGQVTGSITGGHFCAQQNVGTVFFAATFDRPFTDHGTWNDTAVADGSSSAGGLRTGAWVGFDTTQQAAVKMKVAISYVSADNAAANLRTEIPGWDRASVAKATHDAWVKQLSKIGVGGGTHDQQVQFSTALYHCLLDPNVFNDANGQYLGFDNLVHTLTPGKTQYANFSGWDVYRSLIPLLAVIAPDETSQMMQSLVNDATQGGWLPKWPVGNGYTGVMNGDAADPMIASAFAFGATDFDTNAALAAMVKGATVPQTPATLGQGYYEQRPGLADYLKLGYVPNTASSSISDVYNGASETLEYALADFSISQLAKSLGKASTSNQFLDRSQNWTTLFNTGSGFVQPRDGKGAFPAGNPVTAGIGTFGQSGFQEGNAAQYTWMVPQNVRGLFDALGGDKKVVSRLDEYFTGNGNVGANDPHYWGGNEPNMLTPWLYDYAGAAYKTQATVRKALNTLYSNTPDGEPGNDDLGALSSWYVWSAIGLYPATSGTDTLAVSTPLFPSVTLNLPHNKVTIAAPGAPGKEYVHGLSVDGKPTRQAWLPASALTGDSRQRDQKGQTRLDFSLSGTPDKSWGTAPPSYPAGSAKFPPGITPVELTSTPAQAVVAVGAQTSSTLHFAVGQGARPAKPVTVRSFAWTAQPPAGVTVTPSSGTAQVGSDGTATVAVSLSAAPDVVQGFTSIPVVVSTPSASLPRLDFPVAVVGAAGSGASICTTLGTQNVSNGLSQYETPGDGATAPVTVDGRDARETVQRVPGDLNMYFKVDDRLAANGTFATTFSIDYYDSGTDTWMLQYDSQGNSAYQVAGVITRGGTNTWKTATFTVPDAGFAGRENEQTDFRLASGSPLTVSGVHLAVSGPGVLPMDLCP
ncbi:MAG: alpha,2-mannosidase [Amycolatopsis sp.]|uniref:GH92 family glycosyl hydrolase n=1 Tax=Amycolatopsis sp. TaxID=37632 RepID=UPI00260C6DC0|nr:GH92 family glycosyl hydrolase [Amycolatopsis sp.]MCU1687700.1 alpha,2-mannosidase [Amycolatopsis sp.]